MKVIQKIIIDFKFDEFTVEMLMIARRVNFMNYVIDINEDPKKLYKKEFAYSKAIYQRLFIRNLFFLNNIIEMTIS